MNQGKFFEEGVGLLVISSGFISLIICDSACNKYCDDLVLILLAVHILFPTNSLMISLALADYQRINLCLLSFSLLEIKVLKISLCMILF